MIPPYLEDKIRQLSGPILILGASGFVGANLFHRIFQIRNDLFGVATRANPWRLESVPGDRVIVTDLLVPSHLTSLLDTVQPKTIFDCISYGAYSFEQQYERIHRTNYLLVIRLLEEVRQRKIWRYVHAGSSSEYGDNSAAPDEDAPCRPNSHYAVSKVAAAQAIHYYGQHLGVPCVNLRFYSIFGPLEDAARLLPTVVTKGLQGELPPFVDPEISRDFIYVEDACEACLDAALNLEPGSFGQSFNVGSGRRVTIRDVAELAQKIFHIATPPHFSMPNRQWDLPEWYANPTRAQAVLRWHARTSFEEGLHHMIAWYRQLPDVASYQAASKMHDNSPYSVSVVVACYKDAQAIPYMHERLTKVFERLQIDYEIILVNDCSPDNSEEVIRAITAHDDHTLGISHSRNFGSQAAFRSGMEMASKNACVLMDGDLQDPPELIEQFVAKWREGFEVVYGRRVRRVAPWYMQIAYKGFYRLFARCAYLEIPHDAGDFSLLDRRVVQAMLRFSERDLFLRGVRAFVGFRQTGIDYVRPERMFGQSTNNFLANLEWAKKGIISFSNAPLSQLSHVSWLLFVLVMVLAVVQTGAKLIWPDSSPHGVTTLVLLILFFGSANLLAISLVGEYVAKILNESKQRPLFIRSAFIRHGEIRPVDLGNSVQDATSGGGG
ncbi:MAG: NAD-dependent epimerase/dehydratase family protein, partial [Magnetococcales bacterium]|nr:NAD-dependent epimerase/dehydratase family protein [Magnetococcales bacterium]